MHNSHKQSSLPPPNRMAHLPTPPPSFSEETDCSPNERTGGSALWSSSTPTSRSHDDLRLPPARLSPPVSDLEVARRHLRLSMSPEPDFPRLPPPGSNRATPDREMVGRDSRESSPAAGRTPSPDPFDGDRSRSNSPEDTMRPPPLRALTEQNLNAKNHHHRAGSNGARSVMSAYDMITSYIGSDGNPQSNKRRGTSAGFQPNAELSTPITPSFIRDYDSPASVPHRRTAGERGMSPEIEDDGREEGTGSRIFGSSLVLSNTYGSDGTATSQSGDMLHMSDLSRQRQAMGWNYGGG